MKATEKTTEKKFEKLRMTPGKVTIGDFLYLNGVCTAPRRLLKCGTDIETALKVAMRSTEYWKDYGQRWVATHAAKIRLPKPRPTKEQLTERADAVKYLMLVNSWKKGQAEAQYDNRTRGKLAFTEKNIPAIAQYARQWVCEQANGK